MKWGNTRLRVALVLDNTGSMADDGKMAALKTATNSLLTQLKTAASNNGDVYVSIIPFVQGRQCRSRATTPRAGSTGPSGTMRTATCSNGSGLRHARPQCIRRRNLEHRQPQHLERLRDRSRRFATRRTPATTTPTSSRRRPATRRRCSRPSSTAPARRPMMPLSYNWIAMTTLVNNM